MKEAVIWSFPGPKRPHRKGWIPGPIDPGGRGQGKAFQVPKSRNLVDKGRSVSGGGAMVFHFKGKAGLRPCGAGPRLPASLK